LHQGENGLVLESIVETSKTMSGHIRPISGLAFSPDGKILAAGIANDAIRLWQIGS
jgi:hypothetical protein